MTEEPVKRKLSAILSADVKGYSRLMGENEVATIRTLEDYRQGISSLIKKHRGRVVDSPGDNVLAEFGSVVDAVQSAVEIQKELKGKNAGLPENGRMEFRIGINLGDVVEEGKRIYGDGVNIAARIEGLAEGGGICISGTAFDQIGKKLALGYEFLGEQTVKNIEKPVRAYRVLMEPEAAGKVIGEERSKPKQWRWAAIGAVAILIIVAGIFAVWNFYLRPDVEPASLDKMVYPLPDKPSIAVLPFDNMSGDPEQEYFSDGITEEIITALSKIPDLFVIARNSTFTYKGKPVKVKQVAEEFGVRYVLEGSVRKSEDRVRITAQLIDALTGRHLWSERYDRDLKDIFALQDEITMKIITALAVKLVEGDQSRVWVRQATNLDIYLKHMQARALLRKGTKEAQIRYGQLAQEIIDMAPDYAGGYRTLAWYHWSILVSGQSESPQETFMEAFKLAQKALSLDESAFFAHALLGQLYVLMRQYEKAIAAGKRSIELAPNAADAHAWFANIIRIAGKPDEGISHLKQAIRLNPIPPYWYYTSLSGSYTQKGQYEEALAAVKKSLQLAPNNYFSHFSLAIIYSLLDRQEEACAAAKKLYELNPDFSGERMLKLVPFRNQAYVKLVLEAAQKAGLK